MAEEIEAKTLRLGHIISLEGKHFEVTVRHIADGHLDPHRFDLTRIEKVLFGWRDIDLDGFDAATDARALTKMDESVTVVGHREPRKKKK